MIRPFLLLLVASAISCGPAPRFISHAIERLSEPVATVPDNLKNPVFEQNGLSIHWVGHALMLIQMHDKIIVTDPNFGKTVGLLARRMVEPGLDPTRLTAVDVTLISHIHFDHFNFGSIDALPKNGDLLIPDGGAEYTPDFGHATVREMKPWDVYTADSLRITAVPVQHFGGRYGFDIAWMQDRGYTGYVIEYADHTVFFAGDMGYHPVLYKEIGRRFRVDIAILPIAPIEPRDFMARVHTDPAEALRVMADVGASVMIPMHHSTYYQGFEPRLTTAREILDSLVVARGLGDRVKILRVGERWVAPRRIVGSEGSQ